MAKKNSDELVELTRTMLIAQLGLAGVPQKNIRALARCDMNRLSEVMKLLNLKNQAKTKKGAR